MAKKGNIIVGLDIGTTKVCAIVGEETSEGVEIIGIGTHSSRGLRKGVVVNIDSTVQSIRKAIEEAELMAGCEISRVYAGISGGHIRAFNSHGVIAVKDGEINESDVERVIEAAQAVAIPTDREAGVHNRRPGGYTGTPGHERYKARGEGPYCNGCRHLCPEYSEMREQGRAGRGRYSTPADSEQRGGPEP
jgi:Ethanolamine utilization protein EutJ (predicted chaperonin)